MSKPKINPAELKFGPATAAQRSFNWRIDNAYPMAHDADLRVERNHRLAYTALGAQCTTCIQHDPEYSRIAASSLEVTAKPILVWPAHGDKPYTSKAYAIGAVQTFGPHRRQGVGTLMMRRIQDEIDSDSEAQTSVLFSTIGESFFGRLGWTPQICPQVTLTCNMKSLNRPEGVRMISTADVPERCESALEMMKATLHKPTDGKTHIYFIPTAEQMDWHFTASSFDAQMFRNRVITHRGVFSASCRVWILWQHDFIENNLKILHIGRGRPDQEELADVLIAAMVEAMSWSFMHVVLWNPSEIVSAAARVAVSRIIEMGGEHRASVKFEKSIEGRIPSLRWTGQGEAAWDDIEYFSWC